MDPTATIQQLASCIDDGNISGAVCALAAYYQWRLNGGFEPPGGDRTVAQLAVDLEDACENQESAT